MRAGKVVQVRINPRDCMSVVDIAKLTGLDYQKDMSFPAMVSLAISALMQTARKQGIIPDRDGFEYLEMMAPYETGRSGRKLEITKTIHEAGSRLDISLPEQYLNVKPKIKKTKDEELEDMIRENDAMLRAKGITPPVRPWDKPAEQREANPPLSAPSPGFAEIKSAGVSIEMAEAKREFKDLNTMREAYQDKREGISWTSHDEDRYQLLLDVCLPGVSMPRIV